jgi:hypothetical protein
MPRCRVIEHPRRLHLENVAHLCLSTNDFKQRKAFKAAEPAQQSRRMHSGRLISCTPSRKEYTVWRSLFKALLLLVRKSFSPRDSPANSGHLGGATKTLDSMTAALRSKLPNPTTLSTDHLTSKMQCLVICFFHGAFHAKKTLGT